MEGTDDPPAFVEEAFDDQINGPSYHDTSSINRRAHMFNMSGLGEPFIPLNPTNQPLQPVNALAGRVRNVPNNKYPAQTYWPRSQPHGDRQWVHDSYPSPVVLESRFNGNYHGFSHQSSRLAYTSAMPRQASVSGQNLGNSCSFPSDGSLERSGHRTMINPMATGVQQPNTWLSFDPTQSRRPDYSVTPHQPLPTNRPLFRNPGAPTKTGPWPVVSRNPSPSQYASYSQFPWSSDNTRMKKNDTVPNQVSDCNEPYETFSGVGSSRDDRCDMFGSEDCDLTTLVSSYNQDVDAATGVGTLFPSEFDSKDPDEQSEEVYPLRHDLGQNHGQHDGSHQPEFQLRVREGTPQRNGYRGDEYPIVPSVTPERDGLLSPFPVHADSSSDDGSPSSLASSSDVVYCPEPDCGTYFTGKYGRGNFNRHRRQYHASRGMKEWPCEVSSCPRVFKRQDARLKHYRRHHAHLRARPPVPRGSRQQNSSDINPNASQGGVPYETQESVLRNVSSWTDSMFNPGYS